MTNPLSRRLARIEATSTPPEGPTTVRLVALTGTPEENDATLAAMGIGPDENVIALVPLQPLENVR